MVRDSLGETKTKIIQGSFLLYHKNAKVKRYEQKVIYFIMVAIPLSRKFFVLCKNTFVLDFSKS